MKQFETLIEELNTLKNDKERLEFLSNHKGLVLVTLDNDNTSINLDVDTEADYYDDEIMEVFLDKIDYKSKTFDNYLGNSRGVFTLLEYAGIKAEYC